VRVIIDISAMKRVHYDATMRAVAIEAGATVGEAFRTLFETWGVVVPLGEYPGIGIGGHVVGGAFGFLCRQLGLAADYLYAVEVVTVDEGGRASSVLATRESSDPHRDLWWAHTGGGGGNFGIVTRYWFRAPGASGDDPARLLPRAPESVTTFKTEWNWSDIHRPSFLRLVRNHGIWCERHSDADSPAASLWTLLALHRQQFGKIIIRVRAFYRDLFADSGGVPVPGDAYDGTFINHPDTDLADPALNTSGVPWQTLYYKENYSRLQRVKAQWDPRNLFHHALSIR
jgi:hypothetical protein